ncbi:serine hydrolase domain-containing protein [Microbacterium allomyrinae]|uniref:Beta-lactamase family protein n=1 Tax=Microbacterium allomyrinae TaxID=2830666 RepID=A0A9X1S3D0_9MICO|nr:serine hydrolase [Microbacterium allomyrinae]MCC2032397.1 beta-lactamase family protein [Microbacterium allomyrinae]
MTELLPRSRPEDQGVPSAALARLVTALDEIQHVHTATVIRHGHVVLEATWEPYDRDAPHAMYSVSKSFTSMAVGLAIDEGLFALDDRVAELLPDLMPAESSLHLDAMRVRHLLTMSTGHDAEPQDWGEDWGRTALAAPIVHEPGSHWLYNTPATYLLSEIVQHRSGMRVRDFLEPRLFAPLGIDTPWWLQSPTGVDAGGFGLMLRAEELAVFGQLLLQRGEWQGRSLVPASWIDTATSAQIANGTGNAGDWGQGYGFQFWRCRHGAYRGDGAFGQYVVVMPEQDAVVVITGGLPDMQAPLRVLWRELLPAFDTTGPSAPLPALLGIAPVGGVRHEAVVEHRYADGPIRLLRIEGERLRINDGELRCAPDSWTTGEFSLEGERDWYGDLVAVSGGWRGDDFVADLRVLHDAMTFRLTLAPTGALAITRDVGFDGSDVWSGVPIPNP